MAVLLRSSFSRRRLLIPLCVIALLIFTLYNYSSSKHSLKHDTNDELEFYDAFDERSEAQRNRDGKTTRPTKKGSPPSSPKQQRPPHLSGHLWRSDGLLEVNPDGRHPIYDLIEQAERRWKAKLKKQSRTLSEAVKEYKRRYHRLPPKGFDKWWDYVQKHNVQLPDEYDQIYHDLEPFWGMKPSDLHKLQAEAEAVDETYTLGCIDGEVGVLNVTVRESSEEMTWTRADQQLEILAPVQEWLPDFRAAFTPHDGPRSFVGHDLRSEAVDAAAVKTYIDISREPDMRYLGWASSCPTSSPLRRVRDPMALPVVSDLHAARPKTFIYDHRESMDPCNHPPHVWLTGFLGNHKKGPMPARYILPTFSMSVTPLHSDILAVSPEQWTEDVGTDPEWEDKSDERLLWRGSTTGMSLVPDLPWTLSQRLRLVSQTNTRSGTFGVLSPRGRDEPVGEPEEVKAARMNDLFMDVAFTGRPLQCTEDICAKVADMFEFKGSQSWNRANEYKYVMDLDGNGWSARFKRLMSTNSLVFKSTVHPEWFSDRVMPWVHYVPIKVDLTDLFDVITFFRGDLNGQGGHDDLARRIAVAGKKWSQTFWRKEDMTAYMFRLFLEYGRVMSWDREAMTFRSVE